MIRPADLFDSIASRSASFRFTRPYPTSGLNVVPSIDHDAYRTDFQNFSTQTISLHALGKKVGTNNKIAITYLCKRSQFRRKSSKNKVKCSQCCHSARRDCGNAGTIEEETDAAIMKVERIIIRPI